MTGMLSAHKVTTDTVLSHIIQTQLALNASSVGLFGLVGFRTIQADYREHRKTVRFYYLHSKIEKMFSL